MTTITVDKNIARFRSLFDTFEQGLNGHKNHPLHLIRQKAVQQLEGLSFPSRRDEDYKYTSLARVTGADYVLPYRAEITQATVDQFKPQDLEAFTLVFVNGLYREDLSDLAELPNGLTVKSMAAALEDANFKAIIEQHLLAQAAETNPFTVLNLAMGEAGIFVHLAKNTQVEKAIHLLHINQAGGNVFAHHPLRIMVAEQSSQLTVLDSHYGLEGAAYFSNVVNRIQLAANAHIQHFKLQYEGEEAYQMNNTIAFQDRDSTYTNLAIDLGGRIVRNNLSAIHQGQNVTSNLYGAFMGTGSQHIDHQTFIDHAIPHCQSNELYKGILDDKAHGVFNGKVMVRKDAQKTNAFQQNSSLVLSDKAVMDSKPQLEIFADDVKCSHGATIGQLDETSIFYLRSRGLTIQQAKDTLQYAFLLEVLEEVDHEGIQAWAETLINRKFGEKTAS